MINLPVQSFANLNQQNPLTAFIPAIGAGMKTKADLQNEQLKNTLLQIENQYKPALDAADIASKNAYAQNFPLQTQLQQAQLAALLQKINQTSNQPSPFEQHQILADKAAAAKAEAAKQAAADKAKAAQDKIWSGLFSDISDASTASSSLNDYADQFHQAYGQTNETGPFGGRLPALSSDAQSADRAANNMVAQLVKLGALKGGRLTNNMLSFIQQLKPSRLLNSDAEVDAMNQIHATNSRLKEQLPFFEKAKELGLSPDEAQQGWLRYNTEKPAYDNINKKILTSNFNTWSNYLPSSSASSSAAESGGSNVTPSIRWGAPGSTITPDQEQKIARATHASGFNQSMSNNKSNNKSNFTQQDLEFTAKRYGISVDQVKKRLGVT